jgi:hypothetical protein
MRCPPETVGAAFVCLGNIQHERAALCATIQKDTLRARERVLCRDEPLYYRNEPLY